MRLRARIKILGVWDIDEHVWIYRPICTVCGNWHGGYASYTGDLIHLACDIARRHLKEWHA